MDEQPIKCFTQYLGLCYTLLAPLEGLNLILKLARQKGAPASRQVIIGINLLIEDIKRIRNLHLLRYINLQEGKIEEKLTFLEMLEDKVHRGEDISLEDLEMLKCEAARTKTAIGEWVVIFEPHKRIIDISSLKTIG